MKTAKSVTKWMAVVASGCLMAASASAATIVDMSGYGIGLLTPTVIPPSGLDSTYLQNMITVYNGGVNQTIAGVTYAIDKGTHTPNPNLPGGPSAVLDTSVLGSPTSYNIDLGPTGAGLYLIAQWDGPNGADAFYYIGGLTGVITLQNTVDVVNANGGAYGLSGYWLGTSTNPPPGLPDGGTTALMLSTALAGLGVLKRRIG